jgi:hypothetical protein
MIGEHPSLRMYQLEMEVEGEWNRSIASLGTCWQNCCFNLSCQLLNFIMK